MNTLGLFGGMAAAFGLLTFVASRSQAKMPTYETVVGLQEEDREQVVNHFTRQGAELIDERGEAGALVLTFAHDRAMPPLTSRERVTWDGAPFRIVKTGQAVP